MDTFTLLVTVTTFIYLLYIIFQKKLPKNFPPGPRGVPIFGNALQLGHVGHKVVFDMTKEYGDIVGLQLGSYRVVVLNNPDDIREALSKNEFAGRHGYNSFLDENHSPANNSGVIFSDGQLWSEQRRFSLKTLRDFGFGKKTMEAIILQEANDLIDGFKKNLGQPISTQHSFNAAVFNVIWSITASERFAHDDPKLQELIHLLVMFMKNSFMGIRGFYFLFPTLVEFRNKVPFLFANDVSNTFRHNLFSFLRDTIEDHHKTLQEGNSRDLIDGYIEETRRTTDPNSSFFKSKSNDTDHLLTVLLMDLFVAGAETTSTTMTWAFFLLALHPEVQEKLVKEMQSVVQNRVVSLADRPSMPYTEATMTEIYRISTLAPFAAPHATVEDVEFKGYKIPKTPSSCPICTQHILNQIFGQNPTNSVQNVSSLLTILLSNTKPSWPSAPEREFA